MVKAMKFQKGLLEQIDREGLPSGTEKKPDGVAGRETLRPLSAQSGESALPAVNEHLFETIREETGSERNYLKLLGIVAVAIIAIGILIAYLTLPGVGDEVRAPEGLDLAMRDHFLTKEKRTVTDISYYKCDGFYAARVGVETRTDIPNPLFRLDKYSARAVGSGGQWQITATPLSSPDAFAPCR